MRDTVASTKKTLFFMDPECSALNRIWCLYELWQTVDPPPGKSKSAKDLEILTSFDSSFNLRTVVQTVESEQSKASDLNDMKLILKNIKAFKSKTGGESGAKGVDKEIKDAIVLSVEHEVERARKLGGGPLARALLKASIIHWTAQRRSEALSEAEESCDIFKRVHAGAHRDTSTALAIIGGILQDNADRPNDGDEVGSLSHTEKWISKYEKALVLFNEVGHRLPAHMLHNLFSRLPFLILYACSRYLWRGSLLRKK